MKKIIFILCQLMATVASAITWTGSLSPNWNTAGNWSGGAIPGVGDSVLIPVGTMFSPSIAASASGTTAYLKINMGAVVTINTGASLIVKGALDDNGLVLGNGTLRLNGTKPQAISGNVMLNNMELNNSFGATILTGARVTIKKTLTITAGTLVTNDSLVLYSDSAGTARLAPLPSSGALISGNVKVMQYIAGGYRRYRFWSHPFSNYIGLIQAENNIDITGFGGILNGFTSTVSNAPSAFRYSPLGGNDSLVNDPGWRPFSSTYTITDSNRLHQYQGIRLFMRGAKGEGLASTSYTPSAATIAQVGLLNQGTQYVVMAKGVYPHQDNNVIGNPYASPVDIGTVIYNAKTGGKVSGSAFYIWNTFLGVAGQFQTMPITTASAAPYYLQANCAFEVRAAHNGDTLTFTESNKGASASASLLKEEPNYTQLAIYDANYHPWDKLYLDFNAQAQDKEDDLDAVKMLSPDFNFYSKSQDETKLAIDSRPYKAGKIIPLGISSNYTQDYVIKTENLAIPEGKLYLVDKLLKQYVLLQQGTEYKFTVMPGNETQGENRFQLMMVPEEVALENNNSDLNLVMLPNPATNEVYISFASGTQKNTTLRILNLMGVTMHTEEIGYRGRGTYQISLSSFPAGIYMVELKSGDQALVQKLVKE